MDVLELVLLTSAVVAVVAMLFVLSTSMFNASKSVDVLLSCIASVIEKPGSSKIMYVYLPSSVFVCRNRGNCLVTESGLVYLFPDYVNITISDGGIIPAGPHYIMCVSTISRLNVTSHVKFNITVNIRVLS